VRGGACQRGNVLN